MKLTRAGLVAILLMAIVLIACATAAGSRITSLTAKGAAANTGRSAGDSAGSAGQQMPRPLTIAGNPRGHAYVPLVARAVNTSQPNHVIGSGTPAGCTSAAVVRAVAEGGVITFNCGPNPLTITMTATAEVVNTSHQVVLDGGGLVTLSGGGKRQILFMDTCDKRQIWTTNHCDNQEWPQLVVQNMTLEDGYSPVQQTPGTPYGGGGGGAIYAEGGQLKVVDTRFVDNRCYNTGPDLGGAAIRAISQYSQSPIYITGDTFTGGVCSNGGALSSIGSNWDVINSVMTGNQAIGWGANPAKPHTLGGGSGGAIYNDGDNYNLTIEGSAIRDNTAREGGGAVFFVVDNNQGTLTIKDSTLYNNPSDGFSTAGYPGIFFHSSGHPIIIDSTLS
jgi:hypothetical protein